jgi:hypothetical protein
MIAAGNAIGMVRGLSIASAVLAAIAIVAAPLDATRSARCWLPSGLDSPAEHALVSLLALSGLRVSEATGADMKALGTDRGHRRLAVTATCTSANAPRSTGGARATPWLEQGGHDRLLCHDSPLRS